MTLKHFGACLLIAVTSLGCDKHSLVEDTPLWSVEVHGDDSDRYVEVKLKAAAALGDVVAADLFEGFLPSITHDEAIQEFGEPMVIRREWHNVLFYYPVPLGTVEIAREHKRPSGVLIEWKLRAYPRNQDPGALLNPSIAKYVTADSSFLYVSILNPNNTHNTAFVTRNGKVMYAIWMNPGDARKATAQEPPVLLHGADY